MICCVHWAITVVNTLHERNTEHRSIAVAVRVASSIPTHHLLHLVPVHHKGSELYWVRITCITNCWIAYYWHCHCVLHIARCYEVNVVEVSRKDQHQQRLAGTPTQEALE